MNALRLALFFSASTGIMLTFVWAVMWLAGAMSGFVPLYAFIGTMAAAATFIATFIFTEKEDN